MAIALNNELLAAMVTLKRAALSGLRAAQAIEPSGKTRLRDLPNEWQDPVWQDYVQHAFEVVNRLFSSEPSVRLLDQPASVADAMITQTLGTVDNTGHLRGFITNDPHLVGIAARDTVPVRSVGFAALLGLVTAGGLGAFFLGRFMMSR
jgi:hypothetical protein